MQKRKSIILVVIMLAICAVVPIMAISRSNSASAEDNRGQMTCLTLWQIDGFEGGKGSRAQYLNKLGERCFKDENIYVSVTALSADMARENLKQGNRPDIISYPAGFYGLESYVGSANFVNVTWCNGVYCLLTLDETADFSDITTQNTVVNEGKDNLTEVAVALCGLSGAQFDLPANAYLNLLNGKFKYLFGTQRDVFRLKTRGVSFNVMPIVQFNDLYQNVAVLAKESERVAICNRFIEFLPKNADVSELGLFNNVTSERTDGLENLSHVTFETQLNCICSESYISQLKELAKTGEINKIKNLLK